MKKISQRKYIICSLLSLGTYSYYWHYLQWRTEGYNKIKAFLMSMLNLISCFFLTKKVYGPQEKMKATGLAIINLILVSLIQNVLMMLLATVIPFFVQKKINETGKDDAEDKLMWSDLYATLLINFIIIMLLVLLYAAFFPAELGL